MNEIYNEDVLLFLNENDVDFFLTIFNKNYFCSLIIKKKILMKILY